MEKRSELRQKAQLLLDLTKELQVRKRDPYSLATLCGPSFMGTVDDVYNDVYRQGVNLLSDIVENPAKAKDSYWPIIERNLASVAIRDPKIYARHEGSL